MTLRTCTHPHQIWLPHHVLECPEARERAIADSLMTWGHAVAFAGSLVGIAGGFALVARGDYSAWIAVMLFSGPVAGMAVSAVLYASAWVKHTRADQAAWASSAGAS